MDVWFGVLVTGLYFMIGYSLSQIITVNQGKYNPVVICLWPFVFILIGFMFLKSLIAKK